LPFDNRTQICPDFEWFWFSIVRFSDVDCGLFLVSNFYRHFILGHCLQILSDKPDLQLREVWTYFNVISIDKFVFTRCVECNGNCFISIPQKIALILAQNLVETNENCSYEPLPFPETLQSGKIESGLRELSLDKDDVEVSCTGLDLNVIEDCDKMFAKDSCQDNEIAIDYIVESDWFITRFVNVSLVIFTGVHYHWG
jgi:hypothetical protein